MWSDCLIYVSCELELSLHGDMVSTHYKFCVNHKSALSPGGGDLKPILSSTPTKALLLTFALVDEVKRDDDLRRVL